MKVTALQLKNYIWNKKGTNKNNIMSCIIYWLAIKEYIWKEDLYIYYLPQYVL